MSHLLVSTVSTVTPSRGFSLLEVLVAFGVIGVMGLMFGLALQQGRQVFDVVVAQPDADLRVDLGLAVFRKWVSAAHLFDPNRSGSTTIAPFSGQADEMTFSASLSAEAIQDDLYRARIWRDPIQNRVMASFTPDRNATDVPSDDNAEVLFSDVSSFNLEYLNVAQGAEPVWITEWTSTEDLPPAVRARFEITTGNNSAQYTLVVDTQISGYEICVFDPVSRECR